MDKPGKIVRNQIDYILINKIFRNACLFLITYPSADVGSDHCPLVGIFKLRMKKISKKKIQYYDLRRLRIPKVQQQR